MSDASQRAARHVLLIATMLVGVGVVMVYSSSSALADRSFENSGFFLQRQLMRAAFGLTIMLLLSRVPLSLWRMLARPLLLLGVLLLVLVLILGEGRGAQRWLPFGLPSLATLSFQPSELVKLLLVLYLADVLARKRSDMDDWKLGLLPRLAVISVVQVLIVLQPDLGTALAISAISMVILWLGGAGTVHLGLVASGAGLIAAWSVLYSPYQLVRIRTFLGSFLGEVDPQGAGFQVSQSLLALGSGGWFGVGLGNSMQKQHYLPEPHTDFVFAFVGEELGLLGTLSIIGLFVALSVHGYRIAARSASFHGFLVASGITVMVGIYALMNIAVATNLMPTTGLPLPFVSYGGSSLLLNLSGIGILAAVAREDGSPAASFALRRFGPLARPRPQKPEGRWIPPTAPAGSR